MGDDPFEACYDEAVGRMMDIISWACMSRTAGIRFDWFAQAWMGLFVFNHAQGETGGGAVLALIIAPPAATLETRGSERSSMPLEHQEAAVYAEEAAGIY